MIMTQRGGSGHTLTYTPPSLRLRQPTHLQSGQQALHRGVDVSLPRRCTEHRKALSRRMLGTLAGVLFCVRIGGRGGARSSRGVRIVGCGVSGVGVCACRGDRQHETSQWQSQSVTSRPAARYDPMRHHASGSRLCHSPVPAAASCASSVSADAPAAPLPTSAWKKDCRASSAAPGEQERGREIDGGSGRGGRGCSGQQVTRGAAHA
jgi:hypothetical protein